MRPCLITSVVRARSKALRWSAGFPSFLKPFLWEIISREEVLLEGADSPILTGLPTKALFVTIIEKNKKGKCIRKQNANILTSQIETRRRVAAPPEMQARMIRKLPANVLTQDNIRHYIVTLLVKLSEMTTRGGRECQHCLFVPIRRKCHQQIKHTKSRSSNKEKQKWNNSHRWMLYK